MKKKKITKNDLERRVLELEAQLASSYHFADATLNKAGTSHNMAGGILLQLTALGGREVIAPVVIRDGLSDETIKAIRDDITRSYNLATLFKPTGAAQ